MQIRSPATPRPLACAPSTETLAGQLFASDEKEPQQQALKKDEGDGVSMTAAKEKEEGECSVQPSLTNVVVLADDSVSEVATPLRNAVAASAPCSNCFSDPGPNACLGGGSVPTKLTPWKRLPLRSGVQCLDLVDDASSETDEETRVPGAVPEDEVDAYEEDLEDAVAKFDPGGFDPFLDQAPSTAGRKAVENDEIGSMIDLSLDRVEFDPFFDQAPDELARTALGDDERDGAVGPFLDRVPDRVCKRAKHEEIAAESSDCDNAEDGPWVYPSLMGAGMNEERVCIAERAMEEDDDIGDADEAEEASGAQALRIFRRSAVVAGGRDHPDPLCEPLVVRDTQPAPLLPEDDVRIPRRLVDDGLVSSPQLECVALAARRFRTRLSGGLRAGYLLGDGTGCGKGRCIAALILDQWNRGARRHVWLSASADLHRDAARDLADIGARIPLCSLGKVREYGAIDDLHDNKEVQKLRKTRDGVLFLTYSMLVSMPKGSGSRETALQDPNRSRFGQVVRWLKLHGGEHAGLICFDEAHKAKNLEANTRAAQMVDELQRSCPDNAVLYASATGATEVRNMAYMSRLGLWGYGPPCEDGEQPPFPSFKHFTELVARGGMAAMELVAVQLKSMGAASCRSLAFTGATFELEMVVLDSIRRRQYAAASELWRDMRGFLDALVEHGLTSKNARKEFWAAHLRFFKGLIVAAKVPTAVRLAREAADRGEAVVMSLWSTNESALSRANGGDDGGGIADGFVSGPEATVDMLLDKYFLAVDSDTLALTKLQWATDAIKAFKRRLREMELPANPIDELIDLLGGPGAVAEMSGRSHRQCRDPATHEIRVEPRRAPPRRGASRLGLDETITDSANIAENRAFQTGKKIFAIITEAASAGISLHSDRHEAQEGQPPPRPRRMLCLELPWAADKAVQQFGRIHRSNQLHPPSFVCIVSDVGGEARFIGAVTRRLKQLGAMTRGDRHAALGSAGDAFGFGHLGLMSGNYGNLALARVMEDVQRKVTEMPAPPGGWGEEGWPTVAENALLQVTQQGEHPSNLAKLDLKKFLNRLLGMTLSVQTGLFWLLGSHAERLECADREAGTLDEGVVSLNRNGRWGRLQHVEEVGVKTVAGPETGLSLRSLRLDRGMSWEEAQAMLSAAPDDSLGSQGFYLRPLDNSAAEALLMLRRRERGAGDATYAIWYPHRPMSGLFDGQVCTLARLQRSRLIRCLEPQEVLEVERVWRKQHYLSATLCVHRQRGHRCIVAGCSRGLRCIEERMLTGRILAHWSTLKRLLQDRVPLVRVKLDGGRVLVGLLVPSDAVNKVTEEFERWLRKKKEEEAAAQKASPDGSSHDDSFFESDSDSVIGGSGTYSMPVPRPNWASLRHGEDGPIQKRPRTDFGGGVAKDVRWVDSSDDAEVVLGAEPSTPPPVRSAMSSRLAELRARIKAKEQARNTTVDPQDAGDEQVERTSRLDHHVKPPPKFFREIWFKG